MTPLTLHLKLELISYFLLLRGNTVNRGSTEGLICEFVGKGQRIHNPKINLQHMRLLTGMLRVQTRVGSLDFFAYMQLLWFSSNFLYFWYINQKKDTEKHSLPETGQTSLPVTPSFSYPNYSNNSSSKNNNLDQEANKESSENIWLVWELLLRSKWSIPWVMAKSLITPMFEGYKWIRMRTLK